MYIYRVDMMPMRCNAGAMVAMALMAAMADGFGGAGDSLIPICGYFVYVAMPLRQGYPRGVDCYEANITYTKCIRKLHVLYQRYC